MHWSLPRASLERIDHVEIVRLAEERPQRGVVIRALCRAAPKDRPAEAVMDDVRNGYVSLHAAADVYGQPLELKTIEPT